MHILSALFVLPLLVVAEQNSHDSAAYDPFIANIKSGWVNPYDRPGSEAILQKPGLAKRDAPFGNDSGFNLYFCRGADQSDCDTIPISASNFCYDNTKWHGWTTTANPPKSIRVEGPTCCAIYSSSVCNKLANPAFGGWIHMVCEGDTGDAAVIPAGMAAYMCNMPYASAGKAMSSSPSYIMPIPSGLQPVNHS